MSHALYNQERDERFGGGIAGSVALHLLLLGVLVAVAIWGHSRSTPWGESSTQAGAIEASMVASIPLPTHTPPVKDQVLAPEDTSPAPVPPPKEATQPPPKDTDILVKARTTPTKVAPIPHEAPPKHPQPTPDTPKAQTGQEAMQLASSTTAVGSGSATATILDKTFGNRYAYYVGIVSRKVAANWFKGEADPRASVGRKVTLLFDIARDGTPENVRIETRSGSITLDNSAMHALQRIDGFGPLPLGDKITVEDTFEYNSP